MGRIFTNETNYFVCDVGDDGTASSMSFLPAMYTVEAWFRMDPVNYRPDGYVA